MDLPLADSVDVVDLPSGSNGGGEEGRVKDPVEGLVTWSTVKETVNHKVALSPVEDC